MTNEGKRTLHRAERLGNEAKGKVQNITDTLFFEFVRNKKIDSSRLEVVTTRCRKCIRYPRKHLKLKNST